MQTSLLVTCCVTFVLLPTRLRRGDVEGARRMLGVRPQLMHNANLAFAASELLYNNLPVLPTRPNPNPNPNPKPDPDPSQVLPTHFVFGALFGLQYVLLSWWWVRRTGIVYYPFLDPTLPAKRAVGFHLALLSVIATFFLGASLVDRAASFLPFALRAPLLYAGAASLMHTSLDLALALTVTLTLILPTLTLLTPNPNPANPDQGAASLMHTSFIRGKPAALEGAPPVEGGTE